MKFGSVRGRQMNPSLACVGPPACWRLDSGSWRASVRFALVSTGVGRRRQRDSIVVSVKTQRRGPGPITVVYYKPPVLRVRAGNFTHFRSERECRVLVRNLAPRMTHNVLFHDRCRQQLSTDTQVSQFEKFDEFTVRRVEFKFLYQTFINLFSKFVKYYINLLPKDLSCFFVP